MSESLRSTFMRVKIHNSAEHENESRQQQNQSKTRFFINKFVIILRSIKVATSTKKGRAARALI
jgi:hypothetical protein